MRLIAVLFMLCCVASWSPGQWVETTIVLPDSTSGLTSVGSLVFHSPTNTIYVGGDGSYLVAVNAHANSKLKSTAVPVGPHLLCSDPAGNKVYCANKDATITAIDGATNQPIRTFSVERRVTDLCYNGHENKLYCGNATDSFVRVIDCAADSVVVRIPAGPKPSSLCYNPQLNRLYCAMWVLDEVAVIDCETDAVITNVWVRGVEPRDICYDSATNCVYTANSVSSSVSVMDCAGDTVIRLVPVGLWPNLITTGPSGKVYSANSGDNTVSAISVSGVKTVHTGHRPIALSFDPANNKVYSATDYALVSVIDATQDTVLADIGTGRYPVALCYNPAGNNTYVACDYDDVVDVIDGASDTVEAVITFFVCSPGPLCYNTANNHLYCLDQYNDLLFVIDGDSNRVLRTIKTRAAPSNLVCSPFSNKVYYTDWYDSTVFVLDCAGDSMVVGVDIGQRPGALCCSDEGNVYVAHGGGVAVVDGGGDSVRAVVPVGYNPWGLCYDRIDNKVYVGNGSENTVDVIDVGVDSLVATIPLPTWYYSAMCWNENHDKLYVGGTSCDSVAVIDCTSDTVLRKVQMPSPDGLYSDSVCDKVYGVDRWEGYLHVIRAATDTFYKNLRVGYMTTVLDNGKQGPANRLYCVGWESRSAAVVGAYKMDSVICSIPVGSEPVALAWNPTHSRIYVSNSGSSCITVIRDTFGVGVEDGQPQASSHKQQVTVVRGVLVLGVGSRQNTAYRAELLDISGREVMVLHPGANDVRHLAPGVYFLRGEPQAIIKVVLAR